MRALSDMGSTAVLMDACVYMYVFMYRRLLWYIYRIQYQAKNQRKNEGGIAMTWHRIVPRREAWQKRDSPAAS